MVGAYRFNFITDRTIQKVRKNDKRIRSGGICFFCGEIDPIVLEV
jgi:hypothetical protein